MLRVRNLSKTYSPGLTTQIEALRDVSLDVAAGELLTVLGPSGCGKTTLLRTIAGFEQPDHGSIDVGGRTVVSTAHRTIAAHRRGIGYVPQEGALFPHLSVGQNVAFGLRGLSRSRRRDRVEEVLTFVGLAGFGPRRPQDLSGGQQQRVALARAIAPRPKLLLFDEPFSALDAGLRASLRSEVRTMLTSLGATAVLVTHDQEEALSLGDRVAVMRAGRLVQVSDPHSAYFRPKDLQLAQFLGETIIVDGEVADEGPVADDGPAATTGEAARGPVPRVHCAFGGLDIADWHGESGACSVMIRPENITILSDPAARSAADVLPARVTGSTFFGHDGLVHLDVPELGREISVRVIGSFDFTRGQQVSLRVDSPVSTFTRDTQQTVTRSAA